jgi:ureidoacrylate peracid hydrolase
VNPKRTALVVIDVQNDFCHPDGWAGKAGMDVSSMPALIERIEHLIDEARAAGVHVVFVKLVGDESTDSAAWLGDDGQRGTICRKDTWGAEFMHRAPLAGEPVIPKTRYGAFHNTDLDTILKGWGASEVVFAGVSTNVCVESSLREAFMRDYHVTIVSDCVAAYRKESHDATLATIGRNFGRVVASAEAIAAWQGGYGKTSTVPLVFSA